MSISPPGSVDTSVFSPLARAPVPPERATFAEQLRAAGQGVVVDQTQLAAEQFVASSFIQPMLALTRQSSLAAGPFAPGDAERRFGPMLDQHLADNVVKSANFPLVESVREHLLSAVARNGPVARPLGDAP